MYTRRPQFIQYIYTKSGSNWYSGAYRRIIFFTINVIKETLYATNVYATNTCWCHPKRSRTNVMRQMFQKWPHTYPSNVLWRENTGTVALTRIIFFTINVMRQMFMRQILADVIPKFQKITRQMLCDKCSKNDVTLIPQNANVIWRENFASPQNADVIWLEIYPRWGLLYY